MTTPGRRVFVFAVALFLAPSVGAAPAAGQSANQPPPLLSDLVDVSPDFRDFRNSYYLADDLGAFDPASGKGSLTWQRHQLYPRTAFDNTEAVLRPFEGVVFPDKEYATNPALPFEIQLVSPRTVRLRLRTGPRVGPEGDSLMLVREPGRDSSWARARLDGGYPTPAPEAR